MAPCPVCNSETEASENYKGDACSLLISAYILAGLAMMLNIRLSYSSAPYALIRFRLPENLFSVFVRRMASALELWCLPSMLLGNIVDLIQKLIDENPELRAIKAEATQLKTKATKLKATVEPHSGTELATTQNTDLNKSGGTAQPGLAGKARALQSAAGELYRVADALERVSTGPLQPIKSQANALKNVAGTSGSGLYQAAEELAEKGGQKADDEANAVIDEFEAVENNYNLLIAKAKENGLTTHDEVTEVVKAYHAFKNTYYQMLITYRFRYLIGDGNCDDMILHKGELLYSAADTLVTKLQPKLQGPEDPQKQLLKDLANALATAVGANENGDLQQALNQLKSAVESTDDKQIVTKANDVITKFKDVKRAYEKVKEKEEDYNKLARAQYPPVGAAFKALEEKFGVLQKSYENVLRLRVQELAKKSEELKTAANQVGVPELREKATALATAAMGSADGLHAKAEALVESINNNDDPGSKATHVITQFDKVANAYDTLAGQAKYQELLNSALAKQGHSSLDGNERNVKNVENAYTNLKKVYDSILYFTKIKHYSTDLDTKATSIPNPHTAKQFKDSLAIFGNVYNSIPDDIKSIFQNEFESLKNDISGEMKRWKFFWIIAPSIFTQWLNFLTYVVLLIVYLMGGDQGHLTVFYFVIAISGVVFGINMTLLYAVDFYYIPVYIVGENSFPILTSFIHYLATLIFGNRRKWNSDFIVVNIDIWVAIIISFIAAVVWTVGYVCELDGSTTEYHNMKHIHAFGFGGEPHWEQLSPFLMIVVGMGLVYAIYPGIAPGMIVPFYLIDKIEMVLLVATLFPPVIIALLRRYKAEYSPQYYKWPAFQKWSEYPAGRFFLFLDTLMVTKITLAYVFIYSLHYRDSNISRSIINQPKMSTFLSIVFYMCHEILLALGFSGFIGNNGGDYILIPQYIGALFMIFLAFYSEGYIIEYKSHDPAHWPTS